MVQSYGFIREWGVEWGAYVFYGKGCNLYMTASYNQPIQPFYSFTDEATSYKTQTQPKQ